MSTAVAEITPIEVPPLGCPETLMPTPADLKNMVKQIAALPAKILALIQVQSATMAQDEIDGLMSEVEQLQEIVEEDKEKRKLIDVHNNAEQLVYQTEKQISDLGDKEATQKLLQETGALP